MLGAVDTAWTVIKWVAGFLLHGGVAVAILLGQKRQPTATLAWLLTVLFLPFGGILLYLVIGRTRSKLIVRRSKKAAAKVDAIMGPSNGFDEKSFSSEPRTCDLLALGKGLGIVSASRYNQVEMLVDGPATYRALFDAIEAAQRQVHVEFYIIQPDGAGQALRDRLVAAARRGVEVRLLYDDVGSKGLSSRFWDPLTAVGGRVAAFNHVSIFTQGLRRRDRVDFRNHRKNVIIDGRIGFTGGINIGREYLGLDPEVGRWRDTHMRVVGPAALGLQRVFALDWNSMVDERIDFDVWFPNPGREGGDDSIVQIVDSGPDSEWSAVEQITYGAINSARQRAWLATPYFVPSPAIEFALISAALRGVDVQILLPEKADSLVVGLASRSYFGPLLQAGVKLHLYRRGFMHAKTLVVDDWMGTVGSANMDMRSFRLNFELNAFIYDTKLACDLAAQFMRDVAHARPFTRTHEQNIRLPRRFAQQAARLLSPLL